MNAVVTMTGGTIKGNSAKGLNGEELTSGTYQYTNSCGDGGAIFVNAKDSASQTTANADESAGDGEGTFIMTGGTITDNYATGGGGGIYGSSDGQYEHYQYTHYNPQITISGTNTVISNNHAKTGGGIRCGTGGSVNIYDGVTITGNYTGSSSVSGSSGGGIYVNGAGLSINTGSASYEAVTISNNTADLSGIGSALGGGIYATGTYSSLTIENAGATITGNTASGSGGGIAATCWYVDLSGGSVSGNSSGSKGGGIYLSQSNSSSSSYNLFGDLKVTNNTSVSDGGGVYATGSALTQLNVYGSVEISGNSTTLSSSYWGGGLYADRPTSIYGSVVIRNNSAGQGGGLYLYAMSSKTSTYTIADSVQITGNTAVENGGGIYLRARSSSYAVSLTINSATAVLANNAAGTSGADLYTYGTAETLNLTSVNGTSTDTTDDNVTFTGDSTNTTITGWYDDSSSARWASQTASGSALTSFSSGTSYALIAAYARTDGHTYGTPTWSWTGTNGEWTSASAKFTCTTHTDSDNDSVTLTSDITTVYTSATCTTAGYTTYTALVTYDGVVYTDTKTADNSSSDPATGHSYSLSSTSWASSGEYTTSNVYAFIKCSNENSTSQVYASSITSEQTNDGLTFTATFEKDGSTFTATRTVVAAVYKSTGVLYKYYTSADTAFGSALTNGYTTKLLSNCTMTTASYGLTNTKHTIDLNGFTLTYTGDDTAFAVSTSTSSSARTLTVTDSSESGTGKIVSTNGASIFEVYYALVISGGTYQVTSSDGSTTAGAIVEGCGYAKSKTNYGCTVTVTDGIFDSTFYEENETYDDLTTVAISGGWFISHVAEDHCADGYKPYANATGTAANGVEGMYTVGTFSAEIDYSSNDEEEEEEKEESGSDEDEDYTYTYNPSGTSVDFTVTFAGNTQDNSTYSVKYTKITETTDEEGNTTTTETALDDDTLPTDVGTYTATVVSNSSSAFVGSGEAVTFTIVAKSLSADMLSVSASAGSSPTVTVTDGSATLTEDSDYTVSITDADENTVSDFSTATAYTVTVTAVSGGNYTDSCSAYAIVYSIDGTVSSIDFVTSDSYSTYGIASSTEKTGYTFYGWYGTADEATAKSGTQVTTLTTAAAQVLYGTYAANSYTISFDANGGSGDSMASLSATYDTAVTLTGNTYSLTGYTFAGWNTASDGSGTTYSGGTEVTNLTSDAGGSVTLYAQWTANTYTIVFDANAADAEGTTDSISATYGVSYELTNGYTLADYNFAGWNTAADGSGTTYSNGTSAANLTTEDGATVTLYAQWTAKTVVSAPDFSALTFTYDGTAKTYTGTLANSQGLSDFTITYTDADGNAVDSPTDAGTYNVIISRAEDDTYASFSQTITGGLEITQAEQSVSFASETISAHVSDSSASENALSGAEGTVAYTSSDESVATVDADGNVTIVGVGEVTITATVAATTNYAAASAGYTLTVTDHQYSDVTWTWSDDYTTATAAYACDVDGCDDTQNVEVAAVIETVQATADADGSITYTVSITLDGVTYTDTKVVVLEATGTEEDTSSETDTDTDIADTAADTSAESAEEEDVSGEVASDAEEETGNEAAEGEIEMTEETSVSAPVVTGAVDETLLIQETLESEEAANVETGGKATYVLTVQTQEDEAVSESDVTAAEDYLSSGEVTEAYGEMTVGMYLDISLYLTVTDADGNVTTDSRQITGTGKAVYTITITIPAELINTNSAITRSYAILSVHEGTAEILDCVHDADNGTLTFETNKFSTYAIIYTDTTVDETAAEETESEGETEPEEETEEETGSQEETDTEEETEPEEETEEETDSQEETEEETESQTENEEEAGTEETAADADSDAEDEAESVDATDSGDSVNLSMWLLILLAAAAAAGLLAVRIRHS